MHNWKTGSHSLVACFTSDNGIHTMSARSEERMAVQPGSVLAMAIKRPRTAVTKSMSVCARSEWCKRLSRDCTRTCRCSMSYQSPSSPPLTALNRWTRFRIRLMERMGTCTAGTPGEQLSRLFSKWNRLWRRMEAEKKIITECNFKWPEACPWFFNFECDFTDYPKLSYLQLPSKATMHFVHSPTWRRLFSTPYLRRLAERPLSVGATHHMRPPPEMYDISYSYLLAFHNHR